MFNNASQTYIQEEKSRESNIFESDFEKFLKENNMYEEEDVNENEILMFKCVKDATFEIVGDNGGKETINK